MREDSSDDWARSRSAKNTRDWHVIVDNPVVVRNGCDVGIAAAGRAEIVI
jgi:hypothetical protein